MCKGLIDAIADMMEMKVPAVLVDFILLIYP
jgi:hypothetical protein